jgi:hypothetical protein
MADLAQAFGGKFNKVNVRTRTFELGGHTFKVKVPLTSEVEAMNERLKVKDEEAIEQYYKKLTADLVAHKDDAVEGMQIEFTENDVILDGRSMREAASNKSNTDRQITEMFKYLVPEEEGFDMTTITYEMIDELFPFSIQVQVMEQIAETISPEYSSTRGKSLGQSEGKSKRI